MLVIATVSLVGSAPLFLLSFRQRDPLARTVERIGWTVVAAGPDEAYGRRLLASGARVALIDARDQAAEALSAVRGLADTAQTNGIAVLVLLARREVASISAAYEAGATHYLAGSFVESELGLALRFAARQGERSAVRARPTQVETDEDAATVGEPARADAAPDEDRSRDALTGLEDAQSARRWIEARLALATGDPSPPVLMLLGLSRFDMVNAAFGRGVGDAIIRAVGRRIERVSAQGGGRRRLVARLAGAEFAIGLSAPATLADAEALAADLVAAIGRPFVAGDHVVTLAARVGIAAARVGEREAAELLRRASLALADARDSDTGRVRVMEVGEETRRADDRRLELDLRLALDEGRIEIVWQPQVSIASARIEGVEALARWRHPDLGELGADALFAAAERSDYLGELSAHVQEKAIAIAASWTGLLAALRIAVNVTAADIAETRFADTMLARVDGAGLARERVTVEVTETGLIADLGAAAGLLASLRAAGLRVAIDDFGTGYSSLAYLKALPLDTIKIDRRLAQDIAGSPRDRIVVRSVIDMARSLGLAVVAEGVETEEQLALLAREGCNFYQGFLCSAPVDADALAMLVERMDGLRQDAVNNRARND